MCRNPVGFLGLSGLSGFICFGFVNFGFLCVCAYGYEEAKA